MRFINTLADTINDRLPSNYVARINEHVMMVTPTSPDEDTDDAVYIPDVAVIADVDSGGYKGAEPDGAIAVAPVTLTNVSYLDDYVESFVQVVR